MAANLAPLSGGQLVVAALRAHRVEMAFSVAGESYLEVLDALYDAPEIHLVTCRQEGGAAFMAEAYGKLTGKPGVLLVTRGPGACNASIGIHTAFQDSTPMVVLVGQVARHQIDREAFQEVDFRRMFAPLAKWVAQIDMAERVPELVNQAFQVATSGRPGPVVLALPEDMLRDRRAAPVSGPYLQVRAHPGAADLAELRRLLAAAQRPMLLVGGSGWSDAACRDITRFAVANDLPVCCSFRRQDIVDNRSPCFAGDLGTGASPTLVARVKESDLLLAVGARIGEITSQSYSLDGHPRSGQDPDPCPSGRRRIGPCLSPDPGDPVGHARIRRRGSGARAGAGSLVGLAGGGARRVRGGAPPLLRRQRRARPRPSHDLAAPAPARRRDRHQRRREFQRLAQPLSAIPPAGAPARPDQWCYGLRGSGGGRGQARPSRSAGGRVLRRRRLSDDRAGIGNVARRGRRPDHPPVQQCDVRHDPHASGAPISRAASSAPHWRTPILSPSPALTALSARG